MGATNELIGVLMIASPELLPLLDAAARKALTVGQWAGNRIAMQVRRLFHLPHTHYGSASGTISGSGSLTAELTRQPPTTLEGIATWVARHDEELLKHQEQLDSLPSEWQTDIADAKHETERLARSLVKGLADRHLPLRLLGVGFVVLGLLLSATGNLI
jgi:hypothetical protein